MGDNRIWFGKEGKNVPHLKKFLTEVKQGSTAVTIWTYQEVGHNQNAKKEVKAIFLINWFLYLTLIALVSKISFSSLRKLRKSDFLALSVSF